MTDATSAATPAVAAGWYPNPINPAQQRWWDGTQWTDHVSAPAYGSHAVVRAAEGAGGHQREHALDLAQRALAAASASSGASPACSSIPPSTAGASASTDPRESMQALLGIYSSPAFLIGLGFTLLIVAATIVFAYLDWRELKRRSVPAPFHWAFSFLGLISIFAAVYPIGRAVIAKRRTGDGQPCAADRRADCGRPGRDHHRGDGDRDDRGIQRGARRPEPALRPATRATPRAAAPSCRR